MKKLIVLLAITFLARTAFAEMIKLKSGKVIERESIENSDKYIEVDSQDSEPAFYDYEIKSVDGKEQAIKTEMLDKEMGGPIEFNDHSEMVRKDKLNGRSDCEEWQKSIADYDNKMESIFKGEPQDLLIILQKIIEANQSGDTGTVKRLQSMVASNSLAFSEINPPEELQVFHNLFLNYHQEIENAIDAILIENIDIQSIPVRKCYEALLDYYQELHSVLIENECNEGDARALEDNIIPGFKNIIETQLSDQAIQEAVYAKVWQSFFLALISGDPQKVRSFSTENGYGSLLEMKRDSETEVEVLRRLGMSWLQDGINKWESISGNKFLGIIGQASKPSVVEFIKIRGTWKFNRLGLGR